MGAPWPQGRKFRNFRQPSDVPEERQKASRQMPAAMMRLSCSSASRPDEAGAGVPPDDGSNFARWTRELLPARPDGLDDVDGGLDGAVYIQMGRIQQVRVGGRFQGRGRPGTVALVAAADIGQNRPLFDRFTPALQLQIPAPGADFGARGHENLNLGIRT